MEFLRNGVTETAANTYTEDEVQTPVSRSEKLAMLIWQILIQLDPPDIEDAQNNQLVGGVMATSQTSVPNFEDDDLLHRTRWNVQAGNVQGTLSEYFKSEIHPDPIRYFAPPLLYAKASIFHGVVGTGNANAKTSTMQIGYTLERVPAELFIAALVE